MAKTFEQPKPARRLLPIPFTISGYYAELDQAAFAEALGTQLDVDVDEYEPRSWSETFVAKPVLPPGTLIAVSSLITVNQDGSQRYNLDVINQFMDAVLVDEHKPRWHALLVSEDRLVEIATLGEVTQWLAAQILERPTSQ